MAQNRTRQYPVESAAKVPEDLWPEFKARATAAYQAPSRKITRELAEGVVTHQRADQRRRVLYGRLRGLHRSSAVCRSPTVARPGPPNLLERLFVEEGRRLKIIPNAFGEKAVHTPSTKIPSSSGT